MISLTNVVRAGHPEKGSSVLVPARDWEPGRPSVGEAQSHIPPPHHTSVSDAVDFFIFTEVSEAVIIGARVGSHESLEPRLYKILW